MAHYSIYIPGRRGASREHLESIGLGGLQNRQAWDWCDTEGPDGGRGVIGTVFTQREESNPLLGYHADKQTWVPGPANPCLGLDKGSWWYGFETQRPPRPFDLAHSSLYVGPEVTLKDGQGWVIPETLQLSLEVGRDPESGELVKMYPQEYVGFCRQAERYVFTLYQNILNLEILREKRPDLATEEISSEFVLEDLWGYCHTALSLNYRIVDPLAGSGFLNLLDERRMAVIVRATIALPDILEVIEKKTVDSPVSIPVGLNTDLGD